MTHEAQFDETEQGRWQVSCPCGWRGRDGGAYNTWPSAKAAHTIHRKAADLAA